MNLSHFSDKNIGLMVGIGFLIGSVHIYVIGTAIGLVHARLNHEQEKKEQNIDQEAIAPPRKGVQFNWIVRLFLLNSLFRK
ncbi:hypothetical protein D3C80_2046220 [compost metagenome]